ncbi:MAG: serine hydrolase domain-containing protein, partial [Candidatus Poribacteria bacterium]|nr:serine hydrolase domain-containing protein [Candidatus Poribacteria bacterium]
MTKIKHQLLAEGVSEGIFPGAVALIGNTQQIIDHQAQGLRMVEPQKRPMRLDTIFDLASLTKPIVVGTLTMQLVKQGQLDLFASVSTYLPEIQHQQIRLLDLLTHTSGYPAWRALYPQADDARGGINKAASTVKQRWSTARSGKTVGNADDQSESSI